MIIQLGAICTITMTVKETLMKFDEVFYSGQKHFQFNTIYSCKVQVVELWTTQKKKARQNIHVDDDKVSKDEDSNRDDNAIEVAKCTVSNL